MPSLGVSPHVRLASWIPPRADGLHLCVLASGSSGNASVLMINSGGRRHVALIDLGLSPRRLRESLALVNLKISHIDSVLITHLDSDHCHPGWRTTSSRPSNLPETTPIHLAADHIAEAGVIGLHGGRGGKRLIAFESSFTIAGSASVAVHFNPHDLEGTASFRIEHSSQSMGFATDLGRATPGLVNLLRNVDVLAIESNYCPQMQLASNRPLFLKKRVMGGAGHLSNHEAHKAVGEIQPRQHVIFIHLSRQCNAPELVDDLHRSAPYRYTISSHDIPTPWISALPGITSVYPTQGMLFK